jgi:hypothetical protein
MHRVNRNNHSGDLTVSDSREPFTLPEGYKVPHVALEPHERTMNADRSVSMPFAGGRPRKMLYIVHSNAHASAFSTSLTTPASSSLKATW